MKNLGYLFNFQGHGTFSPDGKVDIKPEEVDAHNRELSKAEINELDQNCQVGQHGTLYFVNGKVQTFIGTEVASKDFIWKNGASIKFVRNGKKYLGRLQKNAVCFNFRRIS
jgi:hypothetical protein